MFIFFYSYYVVISLSYFWLFSNILAFHSYLRIRLQRGCLETAGSITMLPTPGLSVQGGGGCWDGWPQGHSPETWFRETLEASRPWPGVAFSSTPLSVPLRMPEVKVKVSHSFASDSLRPRGL